jgi:branched-subunit amino acid ABC-type transport system permease component
VQAGSVSLASALAVFVFGLLPHAHGRVAYREYLRRSWALSIVVFGVESVVLDGLVLLGIGYQVPASSPAVSDGLVRI